MTPRARQLMVTLAAVGIMVVLCSAMGELATFGRYPGPYGDILNKVAPVERHVLNVVTSVVFDYRGFDTLGEEFVLFASVTGVSLLLRRQHEEGERQEQPQEQPESPGLLPDVSDAMRLLAPAFIVLVIVFGVYIVLNAQLSMGGGFQGGAIISSAFALVFVAYGSAVLKKVVPQFPVELVESIGAAGYVIFGVFGLIAGNNFLYNCLPLGETGKLFSSGTIFAINCSVGLEVAAGFLMLLHEFVNPLAFLRPRERL